MKRSFTFLSMAVALFLNANAQCTDTKTLVAATDYVTATAGTSAPSKLEVNKNYYGETGEFLDWKGTTGEVYFPVSLPASTYSFAVSLVNFTNAWMNIYSTTGTGDACTVDGAEYKKLDNHGFGANYGETFMQLTWSNITLAEGDYVLGIYAEQWTALRDIVITATSEVFCESASSETYQLTLLPTENGTVTANQESLTVIPEKTRVVLTATPAAGYALSQWVDAEGKVLSTANPFAFKITSDTTIKAIFEEIQPVNTMIVTGTEANPNAAAYNGEGGEMTVTSVADPVNAFSHNVLQLAYTMPSAGAYAGWSIHLDAAYSANAEGTTGIAFWYRTETATDSVALFLQYRTSEYPLQLQATNGLWRYCYIARDMTNPAESIHFYINGEKNGLKTEQANGKLFITELQATNVTAASDKSGTTTILNGVIGNQLTDYTIFDVMGHQMNVSSLNELPAGVYVLTNGQQTMKVLR